MKAPSGISCSALTPQPIFAVRKTCSRTLTTHKHKTAIRVWWNTIHIHWACCVREKCPRERTRHYRRWFCTTLFRHVLQHAQAWLHSNRKGGSSRQNSWSRRPSWTRHRQRGLEWQLQCGDRAKRFLSSHGGTERQKHWLILSYSDHYE